VSKTFLKIANNLSNPVVKFLTASLVLCC